MKATRILIYSMICLLLANGFVSCKKKKSDPDPTQNQNNNSSSWPRSGNSTIAQQLRAFAKAPATKDLDASGGIITQDGIKVVIPAEFFKKQNGTPYNGVAKCTLYTATSVEDMIYRGLSTISTDSSELLESSGMFKLEVRDTTGAPLAIRDGKTYTATFEGAQNQFSATMTQVFRGTEVTNSGAQTVWERWPNTQAQRISTGVVATGLNDLPWVNLDKYMGERPHTNIYVTLPQGFTSANSEVYIRYIPEKAIAFLPANATLQKFTTDGSNYKVIKGRALKILAVAKINNQYFYSEVTINSIQENHEVTISSSSMIQTDEQGLKNKITQFSNS